MRMKKDPNNSAMVTVHEVARVAGVSAATVSRFLNGTAKVSDEKRKAIESVIDKLNYKPNVLAQNLKTGSSRTIGVLTQSLVSGYFADAMAGIDEALQGTGYAPLIVSGHWHADEEAERIELLIARRVDGLVILSGKLKDAQILKLSQRVPIVAFGRALDGPRLRLLPGQLLGRLRGGGAPDRPGPPQHRLHRRPRPTTRMRWPAWPATATRWPSTRSRKSAADRGRRLPGIRRPAGGRAPARIGPALLRHLRANDLTAYGARLALYRRGIRVPEDISIIGFDDLHSSMYTTPPLTTVRQPLFDVGKSLGRAILKMIARQPLEVDVPRLNLVVRESVRRIT
jgi:LacI family transcriptional regulator